MIALGLAALATKAQSNIFSGLLFAADTVEITAIAWVEPDKGEPGIGSYEVVYEGKFVDAYTFKIGTFRDITIIFHNGERRKMAKVVEPGLSNNFHEVDVHFNRATTDLSFKLNVGASSFRNHGIKTRY